MFGWFKKTTVPDSSPARLLADSLTSPETRDEWVRSWQPSIAGIGGTTIYKNTSRDLQISASMMSFGAMLSSSLGTPFKLNSAEELLVAKALVEFDKHRRQVREAAALKRLTAKAIEARSDKTGTKK
jgi:hypothetical protein